jgi:hypothetical protein
VFANSATHGVSAHTHGDVSSVGYIAVAIFEEGRPRRTVRPMGLDILRSKSPRGPHGSSCGDHEPAVFMGGDYSARRGDDRSLEVEESTTAGTGVGAYAEQTIQEVTGLNLPVFQEVVRVRYIWWSVLEPRLIQMAPAGIPTGMPGFPGDAAGINLTGVPRMVPRRIPAAVPTFDRLA